MVTIKSQLLVDPSVHDGSLLGILLEKDGRVRLPIETVHGKSLSLILDGVVRFKADDFREGNIILSVTVASGQALSTADVADAHGVSSDEAFLPGAIERYVQDGLMTVRLDASYGCYLVCVCRSLDVEAI